MIRVGLIGCGFMGRMHANVYGILENTELALVCDNKVGRAEEFEKTFPTSRAATFDQMLSDDSIDVIDICLPTYLHCDHTVRALMAGKHVMCEKPMAMSLEEADRMIEAMNSSGKQLMLGHCIRFWPEYAYLKRAIDEGNLGDLLSINLSRTCEFPYWSSENWLADEKLSGGAALDLHIHDSDFAHYILGKPDSISSFGTIDATGPCHVFTMLTKGKIVAHLEGGWNLPHHVPFKMSFRAIFERGAMIMDGGPLTVYEVDKDPVIPEFPRMEAAGGGNISDLGGYYHELKYFADSLEAGRPFEIVTAQSSKDSLELTLEEIRQIKGR
ncbi:MAG: Gfo/Idh/MocA family oxidoreductase [Fimbriimonadaceae bacterium]